MNEFLKRLIQLHRRDLPVLPSGVDHAASAVAAAAGGATATSATATSSSSSGGFLDSLFSSVTTTSSPSDYVNYSLLNDTSSAVATDLYPLTTDDDDHVRSNASFPLSSFAVIKVVILAMVLGMLLLTSCRVVGKLVCKETSKEQSE